MDHASMVLVALTIVRLSGRWARAGDRVRRDREDFCRCEREKFSQCGSAWGGTRRRAGVRLDVGYAVPLEALRDRVQAEVARHALWDAGSWGMQVVDATHSVVVVRVWATTATPVAARQLEVDLREALMAFVARRYPEALERPVLVDRVFVVPSVILDR